MMYRFILVPKAVFVCVNVCVLFNRSNSVLFTFSTFNQPLYYGSDSAGREKWLFLVSFFLKSISPYYDFGITNNSNLAPKLIIAIIKHLKNCETALFVENVFCGREGRMEG